MNEEPSTARARPRLRPSWGVLAAVALALVALFAGAERATRSDDFCASCHASSRAHLRGHQGTRCDACHAAKTAERLGLLARSITHTAASRHHAAVDPTTCVSCHQDRAGSWRRLMSTEGHASHTTGARKTDCVRCHGPSLHDKPDPGARCVACHASTPMRSEPRDEGSCVRCHAFGARPAALARQVPSAHGPRVDGSRIHGAVDCRSCHDPHRDTNDRGTHDGNDCVRCHRGSIASEVAAGPRGHRECLGCHSAHAERGRAGIDCGRCHEPPPPRSTHQAEPSRRQPAARVTPWVTFASGTTTAVPDARTPNAPTARPAHTDWTLTGVCSTCHRPHTWTAHTDDCRTCHAGPSTSLPRDGRGHNECVGCHDPHAPVPNADTCATCHQNIAAATHQAPPTPHQDCLSCHAQHDPRRPTASTCEHCHAAPTAGVAHGPDEHRNCLSCHEQHGPPAANAERCARCHAAEVSSTATRATSLSGVHQRCESCHTPHEFERANARTACVHCHERAAAPTSNHRGTCTQCHAPHANINARGTDCATCHAGVRAVGSERPGSAHARCQSCHTPHTAARGALQRCPTCHARQVSVARTWPAESPHAGRCESCHDMHGPTPRVACASCHAPQNNASHMGRHTDCVGCHAPHQDRPSGGASAWWNRCATCHTQQATAAQTGAVAHRACSNCHQRPGLRAPTCATCHAQAAGTLLHGHPAHANCAGCHPPHGTGIPERAQCVACHQNRAQHFPDAPRCQSCHPFGTQGR
ncbi:MAG: hypothetical protein U0326_01595 [Polyangiales bacterium]